MDDLYVPAGPGAPDGITVPAGELVEHLAPRLAGTVINITASEHRSQFRNRAAARQRLATLLRDAVAPPVVRRPTRPTRASRRRRLDAKRRRSEIKQNRRPPSPY